MLIFYKKIQLLFLVVYIVNYFLNMYCYRNIVFYYIYITVLQGKDEDVEIFINDFVKYLGENRQMQKGVFFKLK